MAEQLLEVWLKANIKAMKSDPLYEHLQNNVILAYHLK